MCHRCDIKFVTTRLTAGLCQRARAKKQPRHGNSPISTNFRLDPTAAVCLSDASLAVIVSGADVRKHDAPMLLYEIRTRQSPLARSASDAITKLGSACNEIRVVRERLSRRKFGPLPRR